MTTYSCDTNPDDKKREEAPQQLSQTFMVGKWTFHSYRKSHDGKTLIYHMKDGIQIQQGEKVFDYKMNLLHFNPRGFFFGPESKQVVFWAPFAEGRPKGSVALMNLGGLGATPKYSIVYTPPKGHAPKGIEWGPDGKAIFVLEHVVKDDVKYGILKRVDMPGGGKGKELYRTVGEIDFFMPPVSRFEGTSKKSTKPYKIIFGCENGLYVIDPKTGKDRQRLSRLPAMGLHNIEWNPDENKNQVILFFRNPVTSDDGRRFEGVYLVDLDELENAAAGATGEIDQDAFMEQLHKKRDIHTLWYSAKGTYVTWSSNEAIFFRKPIFQGKAKAGESEEGREQTAVIEILNKDDLPRRIKGITWNEKEDKVAFTADNQVWVYDLDPPEELLKKEDKRREKAHEAAVALAKKEGKEPPAEPEPDPVDASIEAVTGKRPYRYMIKEFTKGFTAEPTWVGERVVLTLFEDAKEHMKKLRSKPSFVTPEVKIMGADPAEEGK